MDPLAKAKRIARDCLGVKMRVLARTVSQLYESEMADVGLRIGQMNMLVAIANMGHPSPSDLSYGLALEKSTISRDLQYLQTNGWIQLEPGEDRRTLRVSITDQGLAQIDLAYASWAIAQKKAEANLGPVLAAAVTESINRRWQTG